MTLLEDIHDFHAKWHQRDKYGDHAQRTMPMQWIKRYREAGYPEFVMRMTATQLEEIVDEIRSTTIRCAVAYQEEIKSFVYNGKEGNSVHFFFNTEQDRTVFILKWS